jgi:hypothetical protein
MVPSPKAIVGSNTRRDGRRARNLMDEVPDFSRIRANMRKIMEIGLAA